MLLARSPHFPPGVLSTLAGFVSVGETVEQAVVREVKEEVGIEVNNLKYICSQPWPFPDSLMLGFTAEYVSGELKIDEKEIEFAGWFGKDNLPELPCKTSISCYLINGFINS
jgi:NAD+ diphosphatase